MRSCLSRAAICRSALAAFLVCTLFSAVPASAASYEVEQQAGGDLGNAVVVGDHVYLPQGSAISAWRLQVSGAPTYEGMSDPIPGTITGVADLGGRLYATWRNEYGTGGLSAFSLLDPARPAHLGELPYSAAVFREPRSLVAVGGRLYLADLEAGGLFVIDPASPGDAQVALALFGADEMVLEGSRLTTWLRTFSGSLFVTVLDVSSPDAPTVSGNFDAGFMLKGWVENGRFAAAGPDGLRIFDTTDPANSVERFHDPGVANLLPLSVQVRGAALYLGVADGIHVWDIADPTRAAEVGVVPAASLRTVGATFAVLEDVPVGLFWTEMGRGLRLDLSSPLAPLLDATWSLPVGADPTAVVARGGLAFLTDFYAGLRVASAEDLGQSVGRLDLPQFFGAYEDIEVEGSLAFLANWGSGLVIADISNPASPAFVGHLELDFPNAVDVAGNLAFVVSSTNGGQLFVVDASDPSSPGLAGRTPITQGSDVLFHEGRVLVADKGFAEAGGLRIFDVSNPAVPSQLGHYSGCGGSASLAARGQLVFLVCIDGFMDVVDISVPSSPTRIGRYGSAPFSGRRGIELLGDRALVALGEGVEILDIGEPTLPELVEEIPVPVAIRSFGLDQRDDL
ncbi:MAG: hypothetical protein MI919_20395, partial [Holophagales bacterium]|nr:hypothetical protein [Holophagales bacterium]